MSQTDLSESAPPPARPRWVALLVGFGRLVGFVILLIGVLSLRMLRRADPILALALLAMLALAVLLLAGAGWYADLLLRDSRRERPSRALAIMNVLLGLSLAIVAFQGVETENMHFRPLDHWHLGLLPRAGYGYGYSFGYALPVALGITLAAVGLAASIGARLRKAGSTFLLLATWALFGWYGPQMALARLTGTADLGTWAVYGLLPDTSGARAVVLGLRSIAVYDLAPDKKPLTMEKADTVAAKDYEPVQLVSSPDDRYLAASGSTALFVWSLDTGELLWQQEPPADDVTFSPDSASLWVLRGGELR